MVALSRYDMVLAILKANVDRIEDNFRFAVALATLTDAQLQAEYEGLGN